MFRRTALPSLKDQRNGPERPVPPSPADFRRFPPFPLWHLAKYVYIRPGVPTAVRLESNRLVEEMFYFRLMLRPALPAEEKFLVTRKAATARTKGGGGGWVGGGRPRSARHMLTVLEVGIVLPVEEAGKVNGAGTLCLAIKKRGRERAS